MSTYDNPLDRLPALPKLQEHLGIAGLLLRLVAKHAGDDLCERETFNIFARVTMERLADDIEAAMRDPAALAEMVTRLRKMAPQPTPPAMLRCGLWVGRTARKMWPAITERRIVVVVAQSVDETTMPLPDDKHDWHDPRWCGFIDLGSVELYPWDERSHALDRATLLARKWLTENQYHHYLAGGGYDGRADGRIAEHPAFTQRVITRDVGYTLGFGTSRGPIGGVTSRFERAAVPLDAADRCVWC